MEPLRVALPLGIGDSLWSVMKLRALSALHGGRPIEASINCSPNHATVGYLEICPQITTSIQSTEAPNDIWRQLPPNHRFPKWSTLKGCANWNGFDYVLVANGHLERGEHISTFLPELNTDGDATEYRWRHSIRSEDLLEAHILAGFTKAWVPRVLLYCSGVGPNLGFTNGTWTVQHWAEVARRLIAEGIRPLLVGANTSDDLKQRDFVLRALGDAAAHVDDIVGKTTIPQYVAAIEEAACWIGLNSGGGIVSAMGGTPTVMLWSDSASPIPGVHPMNVLHTNMKTGFLADWQLEAGVYETLSFGSPQLTPRAVVAAALQVMARDCA